MSRCRLLHGTKLNSRINPRIIPNHWNTIVDHKLGKELDEAIQPTEEEMKKFKQKQVARETFQQDE